MGDFAPPLATLVRGGGRALPFPITTLALTSGQGVRLDDLGQIPANLANNPAVRIFNSGAQVISNNTSTTLNFDSVMFDTNSMLAGAAIVCKVAGKYYVHCEVEFAGNAGGTGRQLWVEVNAAARYAQDEQPPNGVNAVRLAVSTLVNLNVNDSLVAWVRQDSGGNLATTQANYTSPQFMAARVA